MRASGCGRVVVRGFRGEGFGIGGISSRIVELSCKSPLRLYPMESAEALDTGSAVCLMGGYGGGMLGGDSFRVNITVEDNATLQLGTQSSTKVYKSPAQSHLHSKATTLMEMDATVGAGGLLVVTPDSVVPFKNARFSQKQAIYLHQPSISEGAASGGSCVVVDICSAGRSMYGGGGGFEGFNSHDGPGERWQFDLFESRIDVHQVGYEIKGKKNDGKNKGQMRSLVTESVRLQAETRGETAWGMDIYHKMESFASVIIAGPRTVNLAANVERVARQVNVQLGKSEGLRISPKWALGKDATLTSPSDPAKPTTSLPPLEKKVIMSVSRHDAEIDLQLDSDTIQVPVVVARIASESAEDIIRVLHHCLAPLESELGEAPYHDRIHARNLPTTAQSPASSDSRDFDEKTSREARKDSTDTLTHGTSDAAGPTRKTKQSWGALWSLMTLSDAALPTGGFAHSGGLEAAKYLRLLGNKKGSPQSPQELERNLKEFVRSSVISQISLQAPFCTSASRLARTHLGVDLNEGRQELRKGKGLEDEYLALDMHLDTFLVANPPARRASLSQGRALMRLAPMWLRHRDDEENRQACKIISRILDLVEASDCRGHLAITHGIVAETLNIDIFSSIECLAFSSLRDVVAAAIRLDLIGPSRAIALQASLEQEVSEAVMLAMQLEPSEAATCAPLLEAAHLAHDTMDVRLFQS
ncbi:hypothetical protein AAMO2058_001738900 [Amorphochlora amoebiformis]